MLCGGKDYMCDGQPDGRAEIMRWYFSYRLKTLQFAVLQTQNTAIFLILCWCGLYYISTICVVKTHVTLAEENMYSIYIYILEATQKWIPVTYNVWTFFFFPQDQRRKED